MKNQVHTMAYQHLKTQLYSKMDYVWIKKVNFHFRSRQFYFRHALVYDVEAFKRPDFNI